VKKKMTHDYDPLRISFILNGEPIAIDVRPWQTALAVIREQLHLTGTKEGCGIGECGACTILVDGRAVNSCLMLAAQLDEKNVETIEGLSQGESMHPIQEAFVSTGAIQCGYCSPGMIMSVKGLLDRNPKPNREEIVQAISGNLCRCTGYVQILEAVDLAASLCGSKSTTNR
jgi:aerobic-type carbon monoxide dehydrogenase small subunit (CoxS/CutS family)